MRSLPVSFSLLLYSSSTFALPAVASNHLLATDGRNDTIPPLSQIHPSPSTEVTHKLERRAGRSPQFMQNFVKGAQLWERYLDTIMDPDSIPPSADFPMELNEMPATADSPAVPGWELQPQDSDDSEMEDDEPQMEWVSVSVDRDGWRYEEIDVHYGDDLEAALDTIGDGIDPDFKAYQCTEWRTRFISLTLNIDCEYGIVVSHNADLKYTNEDGETIRSSQRWSDLTWKLWVTVCPKEHQHNLRYIIHETITNEDTTAALAEAATARGRLNPQNPQANHLVTTIYTPSDADFKLEKSGAPTCNEQAGECDFYSLLRMPNVIGVLYLLMAHANTLAFPYISHIATQSVKKTLKGIAKTGWNMIIRLDKAPC
ncbi:hypothetical protein N7492_003893 [Penicillium capsulatum]|uniref:Uncharacterized protein n=1 Tax=Penicillium capsulatum TaxID=69766 RepID=A0A9W9LWM7_9EURO|nr:hypothetical protein N7492_003893 [Penicillium capsulatum]